MNKLEEKFEKFFEGIEREYDELLELTGSVEIMSDHKLYGFYLSKLKKIEETAKKIKELNALREDLKTIIELAGESDESLSQEKAEAESKISETVSEIKNLIANQKTKQGQKALVEITSKEDVEFAIELAEILEKYFSLNNFEYQKTSKENEGVNFTVSGDGVYDDLVLLAGRIKKVLRGEESICLVAVLKLGTEKIEIEEKDLIIQTSKSSGAGGQHINKTESAVKITHTPTGIFAECQDERSQTKNKEKAMQWLIKKINDAQDEKNKKDEKNQRGELKNKLFGSTPAVIFDYDANKVFVTENKTEYKLKDILNGDLGLIINNKTN